MNLQPQLELARVEAGIPLFGADMDETNLPQEAGIESRAVSFTKGCYVGQELTSRMKHRATSRRRMLPVASGEALPPAGTKLTIGETDIGEKSLRIERGSRAHYSGVDFTGRERLDHYLPAQWNGI